MKKRWFAASLAALMALSMTACGGGKAAETTAAPAETKAEETKAEESKAEEASKEETAEKAPEDLYWQCSRIFPRMTQIR